jgi:VWFA-related protein
MFAVRKTLFSTSLVLVLISLVSPLRAQQPTPSGQQEPAEIIRVKTELVQAEVMVLDRKGGFVEGLRTDQFQVTVKGEPRPLSVFEEVVTGSLRERAQIASARGSNTTDLPDNQIAATDRGSIIFFFLDDVHLSPASVARARTALQRFIDHEMNENDQVAIVSTTGQIGFLQQLTDHPAVLRAALARLGPRQNGDNYPGKTQISEYAASQVLDNRDGELYAYLLESVKVEQQMGPGSRHGDHNLSASMSAIPHLQNRLRTVNALARGATASTLDTLDSLITSSAELPGRKLVFFLSDGFVTNPRGAGALEKLERVTRKAAASGVIVYTMDVRGATSNLGSAADASSNAYVEAGGRLMGYASGELRATREPLSLIANQTGGRAFFDTNSIDDAIRQSVRETSKYYLLAWRPQSALELGARSQARISIANRPDLTVRWRSTYVAPEAKEAPVPAKVVANTAQTAVKKDELQTTVEAVYPKKLLPISMSAGYLSSPAGTLAKISMQIERQFLNLNGSEVPGKSEVDVIGVVLDDRGDASSFKQLVTVNPKPPSEEQTVTWHQQLNLKPGIYQVRVAIRERSTGLVGSTRQWIEVPQVASNFALSSLFLAERKPVAASDATKRSGPTPITLEVDRRFARSSILRFQTYVYNAANASGQTDVWIQASVRANRKQVMSVAPAKVPGNGNGKELPYWSEIPLESLKPGSYVLSLTATDRITNASTTQQIKFSVQ